MFEKLIEKALKSEKEDKNENNKKEKNIALDYEKEKIYGKIPVSKNWEIQVTKTSWNNKEFKYEIRKWKKDGRPGKGVTFTEDQFKELIKLLGKTKL